MESHEHSNKKAVLNRLSRCIGHMNKVKQMVEDNRECTDILIQLSAVKAEIHNLSKVILQEHIEVCLVDAIKTNEAESTDALMEAINKLL